MTILRKPFVLVISFLQFEILLPHAVNARLHIDLHVLEESRSLHEFAHGVLEVLDCFCRFNSEVMEAVLLFNLPVQ